MDWGDDFQFARPGAIERTFPEDFDGIEGLVDGRMAELFDDLERDEVGTDLIGGQKRSGSARSADERKPGGIKVRFSKSAAGHSWVDGRRKKNQQR